MRTGFTILVAAAAVLFLIAYAFKAWGWQRLFAPNDRPTAGALAFAGGAACFSAGVFAPEAQPHATIPAGDRDRQADLRNALSRTSFTERAGMSIPDSGWA